MIQRWLWNFPEGPCPPSCSPSDCQSLTSTTAAIGCGSNRVEHYWSAVLCHTDPCVRASLFLLKSILLQCRDFPCICLFPISLAHPVLNMNNVNQRAPGKCLCRSYLGFCGACWRVVLSTCGWLSTHSSDCILLFSCRTPFL